MRNATTSSDDTPVVVTMTDPSSIGRYRSHAYTRTDLVHDDDAWSEVICRSGAGRQRLAQLRPRPGRVSPPDLGDQRVGPLLLSLEANHYFDVVDNTGRVWSQTGRRLGRRGAAGRRSPAP